MILGETLLKQHRGYMKEALCEAQKAFDIGEVPVGAVVVHGDQIIASSFNQREKLCDPTAHAEIIALRQAAAVLGSWRLTDISLYVTLEPCSMCAGAIVQARVGKLFFGAFDKKAGAVGSVTDLIRNPLFPNKTEVLGGILAEDCAIMLQEFFVSKR